MNAKEEVAVKDDEHKRISRDAATRVVRLGDMEVSQVAQREYNPRRVQKILDGINMDRIGTLEVSYRDGRFWIIDGQHRYLALKSFFGEGYEDWECICWCYEGLTEEQEAKKFLERNDVLRVDALSTFKVGVVAGFDTPTQVNKIVTDLGLKVARQRGNGCVSAVSALESVYNRFGSRSLQTTLFIIRQTFGDGGYESNMIRGLAKFGARFAGRIDNDRLRDKLTAVQGGVKGINNRAAYYRERVGQPMVDCVAASITDVYNSGARGKASLGSYWKDAEADENA